MMPMTDLSRDLASQRPNAAPLRGWLLAFIAVLAAILYVSPPGATPARAAEPSSPALMRTLQGLAKGPLAKIEVHRAPVRAPLTKFKWESGRPVSLADFKGKVVVVNFWATWCAPCRREMPEINALAKAFPAKDFAVVPISLDRGGARPARRFLDKIRARNLKLFLAPRSGISRDMGVTGLPVTAILDKSGHEVARFTGATDWNSDEARAFIKALIADQPR